MEGPMERIVIRPSLDTDGPLQATSFQVSVDSLSVTVGQRVRRAGILQMWNSVSVYCEEEPSGALVVRVMVFSPDWDGPLQIAALRSWPNDLSSNLTVLGCNLDHVVP
jgi:hypothetical protein